MARRAQGDANHLDLSTSGKAEQEVLRGPEGIVA